MKSIGIKLADGTFYPIIEEGSQAAKTLALTTVKENQTRVHVDLFRSDSASMTDAEYVDSLKIEKLVAPPNRNAAIQLKIQFDGTGKLVASIHDAETGNMSSSHVTHVFRTPEERAAPSDYTVEPGAAPKTSGLRAKAEALASAAPPPKGLLAAAMKSQMNAETADNTDDATFDIPAERDDVQLPEAANIIEDNQSTDDEAGATNDFAGPDYSEPADTTLTAPAADDADSDRSISDAFADTDNTDDATFDIPEDQEDVPMPN